MSKIYEKYDEKLISVIRQHLSFTEQHYPPPQKFNDKHFSVQKKVSRVQQLVNRFVQKLTVYSNW